MENASGINESAIARMRMRLNRQGLVHVLVVTTIATVTLVVLCRQYLPYQPGVVIGESMRPTFEDHQFFLIDRTCYRSHPVRVDDVIGFRHDGSVLIKRVAAVGNQWIWVLVDSKNPDVIECISDDRLSRIRRCVKMIPSLGKLIHLRLPSRHVYVLGDNSGASIDSRQFGFVKEDDILGRVCFPRTEKPKVSPALKSLYNLESRRSQEVCGCDKGSRPK